MGIYFGIAIAVTRFFAFPLSLLIIIAAVVPLSLFRRRKAIKKLRQGGTGSSLGGFGSGMFGPKARMAYYCLGCGTKHNDAQCPNCGSKMKKAGFEG
jgi:hypothetical protein